MICQWPAPETSLESPPARWHVGSWQPKGPASSQHRVVTWIPWRCFHRVFACLDWADSHILNPSHMASALPRDRACLHSIKTFDRCLN